MRVIDLNRIVQININNSRFPLNIRLDGLCMVITIITDIWTKNLKVGFRYEPFWLHYWLHSLFCLLKK